MKVLLVDQIVKINYKYTFPLVNGLVKAGVLVTLVMDQKQEKENCLCDRIKLFNTSEKGIKKISKLKNYILSYKKIDKLLAAEQYDVLHTEWYTFSPVDYYFISSFKKKYKIKYVATVHDILPFNQKFYDVIFHRKLYSIADSIILQAPENMKRFAKLFAESKEKTIMIPHGHMLDYIETADKKESRKLLDIPENKVVFMFFGQIKKVKGVDILLKALILLKRKFTDLYVMIAGSVWKTDFAECQAIIDNNDLTECLKTDIRYIPDKEIKYFYAASDVCVLPYTDVFQSGVIQLAYGYKKPVVTSDLPAFTQFVEEGVTGFISKAGDVESLANAMERAINSREYLDRIGQAGHDLVKSQLNWNDLAKNIVTNCYQI